MQLLNAVFWSSLFVKMYHMHCKSSVRIPIPTLQNDLECTRKLLFRPWCSNFSPAEAARAIPPAPSPPWPYRSQTHGYTTLYNIYNIPPPTTMLCESWTFASDVPNAWSNFPPVINILVWPINLLHVKYRPLTCLADQRGKSIYQV